MAAPTLDRETILRAVQFWPADEQIALAEEILELAQGPTVEEPLEPPDSRSLAGLIANGQTPPKDHQPMQAVERTWNGLRGLLATDQPPPTDEEVAKWLDEHRMEKYGR